MAFRSLLSSPTHVRPRPTPYRPLAPTTRRPFARTHTPMDIIIAQPAPDKIQVIQHEQYVTNDHLTPSNATPSPLDQFRAWFKEAVESERQHEPEAMSLATVHPAGAASASAGIPSVRIVLLKQVDARGFVFFTNYTSRKSRELEANPHAALVFYWHEIHRSVRVVGRVEKLSREENDEYFHSRPVGSQLGAWASKQSKVIGEGVLDARLKKVTEKYGENVPTPEFWGGWRVLPELNSGAGSHQDYTIVSDIFKKKAALMKRPPGK